MEIQLLSRPDCHLCDEAAGILQSLQRSHQFDVSRVDITGDAELERKYGEAIPVVLWDGVEIARAPIDERQLRSAIGLAMAGQ